MATRVTLCLVSVCACPGWWGSSVTAVRLDSGSPTAQVLRSEVIANLTFL